MKISVRHKLYDHTHSGNDWPSFRAPQGLGAWSDTSHDRDEGLQTKNLQLRNV